MTIHSWAGIGLGKGPPHSLLQKVMSSSAAVERWRRAAVLVVDEVSMLDSGLVDALDLIGRSARNSHHEPFGGLQLVFCGDFFQVLGLGLG